MSLPANCPVLIEAQDILACQQEITRKLRQFKTTLQRCRKCPLKGECDGLKKFNQAIDQAVDEVAQELGL